MRRRRVDDAYMASWFDFRAGQQTGSRRSSPRALSRSASHPDVKSRADRVSGNARAFPASYGGFETFAEELSTRLVARGHRSPSIAASGIAQPSIAAWTALPSHHPAQVFRYAGPHLYFHAAPVDRSAWMSRSIAMAPTPSSHSCRGFRYSCGAQRGWHRTQAQEMESLPAWYLVSEWLATFCPTVVVTDARGIQDYYRRAIGRQSTFIPYGAEWARWRAPRPRTGSAWSPAVISSTSAAWNRRTVALEVRQAFEKVARP